MTQSALDRLAFGGAADFDPSIADRVGSLVGSEILKIAAEIRGLVDSGKPVCNLTVGDFNPKHFPIPAALRDAIIRALNAGETNYPPSDGVLALRRAVVANATREFGVPYPIESVLIASGARPLLYAAYQCLLNPGDTVIYPVPSWNNNHYASLAGAKPVELETSAENGFQLSPNQLTPHLSSASMIVINSPNNPSGAVMDPADVRSITQAVVEENAKRARKSGRGLFLVFDQIYRNLVFGDRVHAHPLAEVPEAAPWVVTVDGISKGLSATGLRVGWALGAPALIARMRDLLGHVGAWAPRAEQVAVADFLSDVAAVEAYRAEMDERVYGRLAAIYEGVMALKEAGLPVACVAPQGAIYLSLNLDVLGRRHKGTTLKTNEAVRRALLEGAGIGVVPFQAFGLRRESGWFRLSVGAVSMQDISSALPRLRQFLQELS